MKINHKAIRKICVIQLQPFGDVLLTTSYFQALKDFYPKATLTYLMKEPFQVIVQDHPAIDRIISIPKASGLRYAIERIKIFRKIRTEGFDLVIDQQNMPSSQVIAWLSGAPYRIGYISERKNLDFLYNIPARFGRIRYSASQKFDIAKPLGMAKKPYRLFFNIQAKALERMDAWLNANKIDPRTAVLISPGSKPWKKWSAESFARVATLFQEKGYQVLLMCAPGEEQDVAAVKDRMATPPVIAPPGALQHAAALIHRIPLFICNDGGINHLALAVGTKTLAIFGRHSNPQAWSPAGEFRSHRHLHNPDASPDDPSFGLTPQQVFDTAIDLLES